MLLYNILRINKNNFKYGIFKNCYYQILLYSKFMQLSLCFLTKLAMLFLLELPIKQKFYFN